MADPVDNRSTAKFLAAPGRLQLPAPVFVPPVLPRVDFREQLDAMRASFEQRRPMSVESVPTPIDRLVSGIIGMFGTGKAGPRFIQDGDERTRASAEAFTRVTGHAPNDDVDWATAAALNPNSYDPKYKGARPEIRVVRIDKVADQGVVRADAFIREDRVFNSSTLKYNLGDDRGPNANFDPENARMAMYVDYQNGLVVLRQNPSVQVNGDGSTEAKAAIPKAQVWQGKDGSVRIKYTGHDSFAPDVGDTLGTVNGDLVFTPGHGVAGTPGSTGVTVNGRTTEYPWLEIYQDAPNGNRHTIDIQRPPAKIDNEKLGPNVGLFIDHDIGSGVQAIAPFQERTIVQRGPDNFSYAQVDRPSANAAPVGSAPKAPVYADGGAVKGPGSSFGDKVPAWLSDGEFVMNAKSTEVNRPFLQALNADPFYLHKMLAQRSERTQQQGGTPAMSGASVNQPATVNISASNTDDIVGRLKVLAMQWELTHSSR